MTDPRKRIRALGGDPSIGPIAICEFCDHMVQHAAPHTLDETIQVATFLREQLFKHIRECHPERMPE